MYIPTDSLSIDVGASQLIIDGKIKLKSDSQIERFTKNGIKFENGSELEADVVVFSTGCVSWLFVSSPRLTIVVGWETHALVYDESAVKRL